MERLNARYMADNVCCSFRLPLCLWYDARSIAAAALLMGYHGHDIKFPADTSSMWGQYLEANSDLIGGKCLVFPVLMCD